MFRSFKKKKYIQYILYSVYTYIPFSRYYTPHFLLGGLMDIVVKAKTNKETKKRFEKIKIKNSSV